jgi:hypothetical protein
MSTKIPNGFRLAEGTELTTFKRRVRSVIDPLRDQEDLKLLAVETAKYVDDRWLAGDPILPDAAAAAYAQWAEAQSKMSVRDFDHDRNRFELSLGTDPGTGRIMMIARAENGVLLDAFKDMDEVEEYGYWDHTDSYPEGVTRADWKIRKATWDRMLPGAGQISKTMDTWVLRKTVAIREELRALDRILLHVPEAADRARNPGQNAYADFLFREQGVDVMRAVNHVVYGRGTSVRTVIDTVASYLPQLTRELLTDGSDGGVIGTGYKGSVKAECAALFEQDKAKLARND